jgi:hypothetical protein
MAPKDGFAQPLAFAIKEHHPHEGGVFAFFCGIAAVAFL